MKKIPPIPPTPFNFNSKPNNDIPKLLNSPCTNIHSIRQHTLLFNLLTWQNWSLFYRDRPGLVCFEKHKRGA